MNFGKILLLAQNALGDVLLTTGFSRAVRETFPKSHIALLCPPFAAEIVRLPWLDEIIPYAKGMSLLPVIRRIWRYDIALCLDFKYRSAVLPFLARIPVRAGITHKRRLFMTHPVSRHPRHEAMYFPDHLADIMQRAIGLELSGDLSRLHVAAATAADRARADEYLAPIPAGAPLVAIAPFSSTRMKDWPPERYAAFMAALGQRYGSRFLILGGPDDRERPFPLPDEALDLRGRLPLTATAEVLRRADYFVGSCSAPLHIAAAVDCPVLAFYGPTSPAKWAPRHKCITLCHPQPCAPCDAGGYGAPCGGAADCMKAITVAEALAAFQRLREDCGAAPGA